MRILMALLFSTTLLVLMVVPSALASTSVVPNGGFEQGGCGDTQPICGWQLQGSGSMYLDSPHSGSASMALAWSTDFYTGMGFAGISAQTEPAFCAAIGPGVHQSSFWYGNTDDAVYMGAAFYQDADCTGAASYDSVDASGAGAGWHQAAGNLSAPPGTQSAIFSVGASTYCDYAGGCSVSANFDDLTVEGGVVTTPGIISFTPGSGPVGASVDIHGANFTGATDVEFNGTQAGFTVDSDSEIHATVPRATDGPISVTTPAGIGISHSWFTVTPSITSFSPAGGPIYTIVDIRGANFTNASGVKFNGTPAYYFRVESDTEIHASVPIGATTGPISVTTPDGTGQSPSSFTVQPDAPPIALFTLACAALTCSFDASHSTDPDGTVQSYSWTFGDGTSGSGETTTHTYAQPGAKTVTLTVTDNSAVSATASQTLTLIALSARVYKGNGHERVVLSWSGASGVSYDVYRDGVKIAAVQATAYTDNLNGKVPATYTYRVCQPASSTCSNDVSVSGIGLVSVLSHSLASGTVHR